MISLGFDPLRQRIPVTVVTGEAGSGRSRSLGAGDHVTKTIDRRRLAIPLGPALAGDAAR